MKAKVLGSNPANHPKKVCMTLYGLKMHAEEIWYLLRTRQVECFWATPNRRFIGPWYAYYDGSHYAFGFWFFTVGLYAFKDMKMGLLRCNLIDFVEKLKMVH